MNTKNKSRSKDTIKSLPKTPGCYLFKDTKGDIIYVGKAKNLRSRVGSYFNVGMEKGTKTNQLISKINDIDHVEAESELEAFILEAELIKKYRPRYNINLKDDKSYLYIAIRDAKTPIGTLSQVETLRKSDIKQDDVIFGPFPDGSTAKYILKTIRRIFPFKDCSSSKFTKYKSLKRSCLYGDLGICSAPCVNNTKEDLKYYNNNIKRIRSFLSGKSDSVINDLKTQMKEHAGKKEYEEASKYRDLIDKFEYIRQSFRPAQKYIENPYLLDDIAEKSLRELKENVVILKEIPKRIECYDISNISGKEAVGSMVVASDGKINKDEYRKFKIKLKNTPDDFFMMQEVLRRRLKREMQDSKLKNWGIPDLIVLDGGKGQVSSVLDVLEELDIYIPVIGLAKKNETIIFKNSKDKKDKKGKKDKEDTFKEINLPKDNEGLKLLISLRDESHRFAQEYHHLLRVKKLKSSI